MYWKTSNKRMKKCICSLFICNDSFIQYVWWMHIAQTIHIFFSFLKKSYEFRSNTRNEIHFLSYLTSQTMRKCVSYMPDTLRHNDEYKRSWYNPAKYQNSWVITRSYHGMEHRIPNGFMSICDEKIVGKKRVKNLWQIKNNDKIMWYDTIVRNDDKRSKY